MKIIIINPPAGNQRFSRDGRCQSEENTWLDTFPPTTLASIGGALRNDYEIKLIDCIGSKISKEECLKIFEQFLPEFTVFNTSTPTIDSDLDFAKVIKEKTRSKIIVYGEHISARYKTILKENDFIDFAILGEPETPILNILKGDYKCKGVATRNFDGGFWQEPNLDLLPFPAYDLLPEYRYPLTVEKWMFVRSGRGCPFNCSFCVMPLMSNRNARYHSVDYMVRQIKWLVNDLDIKLFMIWDELSTLDKKRMISFCEALIREGLAKKCAWFCTTRVDCFDDELAENMKKAGCKIISFGIESGSQYVLDRNCKGATIEQIKKAVKTARRYGLKTIGHFIIGLPGSSPKTEKETIKLAKKLKLNFAQFYIATPFPGSRFYEEAVKNGWRLEKNWDKVEQGSVTVSYPDFSAEEIKKWKNKAYRSFYFRPYFVYSLLSSISVKTLLKLPGYSRKFLSWTNK